MKHIELQQQLCQFGLNPQEWTLQQISPRAFAIRDRKDQQTCFWGLVAKNTQTLKWKKLQVAI